MHESAERDSAAAAVAGAAVLQHFTEFMLAKILFDEMYSNINQKSAMKNSSAHDTHTLL